MTDVPMESLHAIFVHLECEQRQYEETNDPRRFDHVFGHVAKAREWLSSIDKSEPGLEIRIV